MIPKTKEPLAQRGRAFTRRQAAEYARLHKEYTKSYQHDQKTAILRTLKADLDVRDKWLGIRQLKQKYQPRPYHRKYADGTPVAPKDLAEQAAQFLAQLVWAKSPNENNTFSTTKIGPVTPLRYDLTPFEQ